MDYKQYLLHKKGYNNDSDQCHLDGSCSPSPTLSFLHEFIISYHKELAFYLLKLKQLGINNEQIKEDIINILSGIIVNVEYSEEQFFSIITKLYSYLLQARELYISVCKRNDLETELLPSKLKLPQTLSFSDAIARGQKIFKKKFDNLTPEHLTLFELVLNILKSLCVHLVELKSLEIDDDPTYEAILKLLSLGNFHDLFEERSAQELLDEFVELDHKLLMKLYDIKVEKYGSIVPTKVPLATRPNKAILVSGSNLRELELILEATKDRNIDIYTHGHMITAHAYPLLKKYPHLVGNYGKEIDTYLLDFAAFPGAIFMTRHAFKSVKNLYRSRVFTTDVIAPKGVILIKNNDFEPLIESALSAKGFNSSTDEGFININLDEKKILAKVNDFAEKIEKGEVKNVFAIGISNQTKSQREYFEKFLNLLNDDSFVLSFSYTNNQKNVVLVETDYGFPILFKAIETLTQKIKMSDLNLSFLSTRCEIHTLSCVIYLKFLGIKNVYFNDCSPAMLNPSSLKGFRKMFDLKEYTTPEADLRDMLKEKLG